MSRPDQAEVWTKTKARKPMFSDSYYCTHTRCGARPAILLDEDGSYIGTGVCLRHAAVYLDPKAKERWTREHEANLLLA